ncbi:MAG TPA: response regulator [Candidatus Omnitrophota bacterium]|nr:response regulator [Candidatus Omnitrophota bacterium]
MGKKILIIDDDIEMAEIMGEMLKKKDYEVILAHDGLRAIEKSNQEKIDLILLDIRMPFFSGFWFCDAFKQRPQTKDIPVAVVSALTEREDIEKAYSVGASAYLKKPFQAKELLEIVNRLIGKDSSA